MSQDTRNESGGYLFTEIDYFHPFDAPDAERVSVTTWFSPHGCRASVNGGIEL
jgi:hypothetical protein